MPGLRLPKRREIEVNASIWKRLFAFLIDVAIVLLITSPLFNIVSKYVPLSENENILETITQLNDYFTKNTAVIDKVNSINMAVLIIAYIYFVLFEYILSQTPGKIFLKLTVKHIDPKEKKLKFYQCLIRNLFVLVSFIIVIDIVNFAFRGVRLSDFFAKTRAVEVYTE
ncbi:MAG: RDD family protein [archaeon]